MTFVTKGNIERLWIHILNALKNKVTKVEGKGLSTNDYTNEEKNKLANIADGANNYILPTATSSAIGGIKSGTDIIVDNSGNVSVVNDSHNHSNSTITSLDASKLTGAIPSSLLPSFVDDVLEYSAKSSFPSTGESGKIYVDLSTNLTYRWSGSAYVEISPSLALGTTSSTAYRGDRGASAYAHAVTNKGAAFSSGLYKITTNSEGHVTAATAVAKSDITGLGIPAQDTTYSAMTAATSSAAGKAGLVPAPAAGKQSSFLRGDGTWVVPTDTKVQQARSTSSSARPILLHNLYGDYGTDVGNATDLVYYNESVAVIPSTGTIRATSFSGSGASLTSLNASNISSGTIAAARLPAASTSAQGAMTTAMVTKLNGIAEGANAYTHPTSAGNKHIPSGGASGQYLKWSASGTAVWSNISSATCTIYRYTV